MPSAIAARAAAAASGSGGRLTRRPPAEGRRGRLFNFKLNLNLNVEVGGRWRGAFLLLCGFYLRVSMSIVGGTEAR